VITTYLALVATAGLSCTSSDLGTANQHDAPRHSNPIHRTDSQAASGQEPEIDVNELALDEERFVKCLDVTEQMLGQEEDYLTAWGRTETNGAAVVEFRDLGLGLKAARVDVPGRYLRMALSALLFVPTSGVEKAVICRCELKCEYDARVNSVVLSDCRDARIESAGEVELGDGVVTVRRRSEEHMRRAEARVESSMGSSPALEVPTELARIADALSSPFEALVLGKDCRTTLSGRNPESLVEQLADAGRVDLIRKVLRSQNPEGRAAAALYLKEHALLSVRATRGYEKSDVAVVGVLREQSCLIDTCSGDVVLGRALEELMAEASVGSGRRATK